MLFSMSGCIEVVDGVSQEEYDALKEAYDEVVSERDALLQNKEYEKTDFPDDTPDDTEDATDKKLFDEKTVLSQLEVTEYSYSDGFWHYAFLVIKNNSKYDLDISASAKFYDDKGELVGAKMNEESPFASGSEIVLYFMPDERFAKMEYEFSIDEEEWYESVVHELSYESTSAKNKEIFSVTNNGKEAAEFVEGYALFFDGDKVVGFESKYFVDDDSELKPGKTIFKELDCYEKYTSVRFFLTGRRHK